MNTILIVEDDKSLAQGLSLALKQPEFNIVTANDIKTAVQIFSNITISLILLDINLPDGNGLEFCKAVRMKSSIPIIILTANDMEIDEVAGLEAGADDYITKPFSLAVLRARVQSVIRRLNNKHNEFINIDSFSLDFDNMTFTKAGAEIILSKTEQKLLKILVLNKGNVLSRDMLIEKVWGINEFVDENALSVTIKRLREKLEDDNTYVKTVYGIGYTWAVV